MNIVFNDNQPLSVGSTRVHIHNLSRFVAAVGHAVRVNDWHQYPDYDVAIFGKNVDVSAIRAARQGNPSIRVGVVNPSTIGAKADQAALADFYVVGSLEERDHYLGLGRPVLVFPQIEIFGGEPKVHADKDSLVIGYHGNRMHIEGISDQLKAALRRLGREIDVTVRLLYDVRKLGRSRVELGVPCEHRQWALESLASEVRDFDIGIVPNLTRVPNWLSAAMRRVPTSSGFSNDYVMRFKNTANAGRAFVFYQLGIPVVADMAPCHFHVLGSPENGYLAMSEEGWYQALRNLAFSAEHRNDVARSAKAAFDRLYDPQAWATRFCAGLEAVLAGQRAAHGVVV